MTETRYTGDVDHINPPSWKGDVTVRTVVLQTCWIQGRKRVEREFESWNLKTLLESVEKNPGADMLSPYGDRIERDDSEDADAVTDGNLVSVRQSPEMDMEDVVGAEYCDTTTVCPTITVGEHRTKVPKARVLRQMIRHRSNDSTDRLRRVANIPKHVQRSDDSTRFDNSTALGTAALCINDPIATLVICEKKFFLCVAETVDIINNSRSVQMLEADLLAEPTVSVKFQILYLRALCDPAMPEDWEWSKMRGATHTTAGRLVEPLDPVVLVKEPGSTTFTFKTDDLRSLALALYDRLSRPDIACVPKVRRTDKFPYRHEGMNGECGGRRLTFMTGAACFVCEKDSHNTDDTLNERFCPKCEPSVELEWNEAPRVLEHMAAHFLFDRSTNPSLEPCGFCARPYPMCVFYTRKGKGADSGLQVDFKRSHGCERAVPFKYKAASKLSMLQRTGRVPALSSGQPGCMEVQP